ncbi:MAG: hypothetical protein GF334_07200 [Candidatus Altiarchaeales archaeon]|nr:hypothetical protein [Candidatus Altiarchaeales archaeon]
MKLSKDQLTDEALTALCCAGKSDRDIGRLYGMTGEGVAYRRKKIGIKRSDKQTKLKRAVDVLWNIPTKDLESDYYSMTVSEFSKKYGVSKTVWLPIVRKRGLVSKSENNSKYYPEFTPSQKSLIIGSLLGDGGIEEGGRYFESHSKKQEQYLLYKKKVLEPYSSHVYPCDNNTGLRFYTVFHQNFIKYREVFYQDGLPGKAIPLEFIRDNWDDRIIAYWFLDDGYFDDENRVLYIYNFCRDNEQLRKFSVFLEEKFGWGFKTGSTNLTFSKKYYKEFFEIVLRVATPDVLYKIPEDFLSLEDVKRVDIQKTPTHPKFYRVGSDETRRYMELELFNRYWGKPFPYPSLSDDRKKYLAINFARRPQEKEVDGVLTHNTSGMALCESFFPNIYKARRKGYRPPVDLWRDRVFMEKLVKNRLKYADRINDSAMRKGMKLMRIAVSNFKPTVARYLYGKYNVNGRVLDYSAGYGSRMLGAMSLGLDYVCYDPCIETSKNLNVFGKFLKDNIGGEYTVRCQGFERSVEYKEYFGVAFSCPPYFDYEEYSNDPEQSIKAHPNYVDWVENYWKRTVYNCSEAIIEGGFFAVCLSPQQCLPLIHSTIEACREIGLNFVEEIRVPFKHIYSDDKYEVIYVFVKGEPLEAKPFPDINIRIPSEKAKKKEKKRRRFLKSYDLQGVEEAFRSLASSSGISRETYKNLGINGVPVHVIERKFGSWNKFIRACGLDPQYEVQTSVQVVLDYFEACDKEGRSLSFYDYGKCTAGKYRDRLKRRFNAGRKYHALRDDLFKAAADPSLRGAFLDLLE